MKRHRVLLTIGFVFGTIALSVAHVGAQPIGTFHWQLQPYCNVVTLNVAQQDAVFTLSGFDDQCGAGQRASVTGAAFLNPDGTVGIGLTTVLAPGGAFVHVDARTDLGSLGGAWRDSSGNSGTFVFTPGVGTGGPARPVAPNGLPPGSVTSAQIAPGAVGAAQLAPGVVAGGIIAAGSITSAHIAPSAIGGGQINASEVQTRVSGTCPSGQFIHGINVDGSASCGVPATATAFVHTSSAANSSEDCTFIDHPLINGDRNAMILATRIFRGYLPGGIGVYYGSFGGGPRWCIYLESGGPMPAENQFNVLVIKQ